MVFNCYCLKFSNTDYSYLKADLHSTRNLLVNFFVQECGILLGGSKICDSLWQARGVKNHHKSVIYFMDGPLASCDV